MAKRNLVPSLPFADGILVAFHFQLSSCMVLDRDHHDLDKMPHEILVVDDSGTDWAGNVILRHWGARVQLNIGSNKI